MKNEERDEPSYADFEPLCKWRRELDFATFKEDNIVEIQLEGFKKEELKNHIGRDGFLYIRGEHPCGKSLIKRFEKKIDVSNYEPEGIEVQFDGKNLRVKLPKKSPTISFRTGSDHETAAIFLYLGNKAHLKYTLIYIAIALPLLCLLIYYIFNYFRCTTFPKWF